jgi:glycosyltransferase involved in cell wall biosynthesis
MKKILIFSVAYEPFVGGAEIAVRNITDKISDIQFDMITLNLDGLQMKEEKIGNVMVYRIGGKGRLQKLLYPFIASSFAQNLHTEKRYDAIWSIMASFSGFAALFFKKKNPDVPFILSLQEGDPIDYIKRQVWLVYPWFKQIFKRADRVQAISHYLANFAKDMGAKAEPVIIPNGVDLSAFSFHPRASFNFSLITVSRLVKKNAVADIIMALKHIPAEAHLKILGSGPLEGELKELAKNNNMQSKVEFLGEIPNRELIKYLSTADIFIRPSLSEGQGISFIEAMAAGLPIIATKVGGIPDFLIDGGTGLYCEVANPKSIAEKVVLLSENADLRSRITEKSRSLVEEKYNWANITENLRHSLFDTI